MSKQSGKGDVHKFVKGAKVPSDQDKSTGGQDAVFPKDRASVTKAEGMNLDFPTSPRQDRYKLASTFRVKALEKGLGK